jgi:hypothetical protein
MIQKSVKMALGLASVLLLSNQAQAAASNAAGCGFKFSVAISSDIFIQTGSGSGILQCTDIDGKTTSSKLDIKIKGYGIGYGKFKFSGVSANLGAVDLQDLEGEYDLVTSNIGVGVAGSLSLGLFNQRSGLSIDAKVSGGSGAGFDLFGSVWTLTRAQ